MKITKKQLQQIIKEEFVAEMSEGPDIAGVIDILEILESELHMMGGAHPEQEPHLDRNRSPQEVAAAQNASEMMVLVKKALHMLGAE